MSNINAFCVKVFASQCDFGFVDHSYSTTTHECFSVFPGVVAVRLLNHFSF